MPALAKFLSNAKASLVRIDPKTGVRLYRVAGGVLRVSGRVPGPFTVQVVSGKCDC